MMTMTGEHHDDEHHERIVRIPIDEQKQSMTPPVERYTRRQLDNPEICRRVFIIRQFL
jgi:hypothetical protein